jgi:hypothetical protein
MTLYDYTLHGPKGWMGDPSRGASLGRGEYRGHGTDYAGPISIREVALNREGYDRLGAYFGWPGNRDLLYWVASSDCLIDYVLWAPSRSAVEAKVRDEWPQAQIRRSSVRNFQRWRQSSTPRSQAVRRRRTAPVAT